MPRPCLQGRAAVGLAKVRGSYSGACVLLSAPAAASPDPTPGSKISSTHARRRRRQLFLSRPPASALSASGRAVERSLAWRVSWVSEASEEGA